MHTDPNPFTFESVQQAFTDLSARHEELRYRLSELRTEQVAADAEHRVALAAAYEMARHRKLPVALADADARANFDVRAAASRLANARNAIDDVKLTLEHIREYRHDLRALVAWRVAGPELGGAE